MLFEPRIGKLIRQLNPYTNGGMETMLCGADPANLAQMGADLTALGNAITTYANAPTPAHLQAVQGAETQINTHLDISNLDLRVDNDYRQDYMTWIFRGQPHAVKRALRLGYRYQLPGQGVGVQAIEHVLIGYAGSNG
jgi:hypothetical protein